MGFWYLVFFVSKDGLISKIPKIMIFVDKIKDTIVVEKYLWSRLPEYICNTNQALVAIKLISSNLETKIRIRDIEHLLYENAQIYIDKKYADMYINISNIICMVQF